MGILPSTYRRLYTKPRLFVGISFENFFFRTSEFYQKTFLTLRFKSLTVHGCPTSNNPVGYYRKVKIIKMQNNEVKTENMEAIREPIRLENNLTHHISKTRL